MDKTPQELAAKYVLEMDPSDFVDRAPDDLAQEIYLAGFSEGKRLGLEEAAKLFESSNPTQTWREFGDAAKRIRALISQHAPSAGERGKGGLSE